jgi:hypothetical protein
MRFALSALFATVLLAGSAGCCSSCPPLLHRDCDTWDHGPRYRLCKRFRGPTCNQCYNGPGEPSDSDLQSWHDVENIETVTAAPRSVSRGRSQTRAPRQITQDSLVYDEDPPAN